MSIIDSHYVACQEKISHACGNYHGDRHSIIIKVTAKGNGAEIFDVANRRKLLLNIHCQL